MQNPAQKHGSFKGNGGLRESALRADYTKGNNVLSAFCYVGSAPRKNSRNRHGDRIFVADFFGIFKRGRKNHHG